MKMILNVRQKAGQPAATGRGRWVVAVLVCGLLATLQISCSASASPETPPTPTVPPELAAGQKLYVTHCAVCHSITTSPVLTGPPLGGFAAIGATRVAGQDARTYTYNSILYPSDYIVPGYKDVMPPELPEKLTSEELDAIVEYVLWLE